MIFEIQKLFRKLEICVQFGPSKVFTVIFIIKMLSLIVKDLLLSVTNGLLLLVEIKKFVKLEFSHLMQTPFVYSDLPWCFNCFQSKKSIKLKGAGSKWGAIVIKHATNVNLLTQNFCVKINGIKPYYRNSTPSFSSLALHMWVKTYFLTVKL